MAASRDPLTGIPHRGELNNQLNQLLERVDADHWKAPLSAIFVDIDHFKEINDRFGHAVGDIVLIEFARLLEQETYSGEVVGRYGGEEFVILCPDADLKQAYLRAERLRHAVGALKLDELTDWSLTASFGVTEGIQGDTPQTLLKRADEALYAAKNGGRNQTRFITPGDSTLPAAAVTQPADAPPSGELTCTARFHACVMDEMLVHKLTGFLKNEQARLVEVDQGRVLMRMGKAGLFGSWGKSPAKQPVEIEVRLGPEAAPKVIAGRRHKSNQRLIEVCIRALAKPPGREVFELRAHEVLREISHHFMVEIA
jgi:diguanylate cyclase (GGDEF)-like protein